MLHGIACASALRPAEAKYECRVCFLRIDPDMEEEDVDHYGFQCSTCTFSYHHTCQGYRYTRITENYNEIECIDGTSISVDALIKCSLCIYKDKYSNNNHNQVPVYNGNNDEECLLYFNSLSMAEQAKRLSLPVDSTPAIVNGTKKELQKIPNKVLLTCLHEPTPYPSFTPVRSEFIENVTRSGRVQHILESCYIINSCDCCGRTKPSMQRLYRYYYISGERNCDAIALVGDHGCYRVNVFLFRFI